MQIKIVSAGIGIFGYGLLWGWALTADRMEQHESEQLDLLESRVEILREKQAKTEAMLSEALSNIVDVDEDDDPKEPEEEVDEAKIEEERTNLQSLIDTYTAEPDSVDEFVNTALDNVMDDTPPFVISKAKYAWDEEEGDNYEKITLTYYPRHRMLLDDEEDPIDDVANMVGWRNLSQFGGESDDPDVVFIRNRRLMTDFEVVRDSESELPLHVKYGMGREEFRVSRAAGVIKLRPEDSD